MKRHIKKIAVVAGLDAWFARRSDAGIILGLHHIEGHDGSMLSDRVAPISPSMFRLVLLYLQSLGYSFVSLDDIARCPDRSKTAAITFDDGFRSIYDNAFPVLRQFQAPFAVFLTTAALGASRLLWMHRVYAAVDRLAAKDVYRIMESCSLKAQPGSSLKRTLGALVCQESPEKLRLFAEKLAAGAGLSASDEAYIAERLYLRQDQVAEMMLGGMTIGAHGHYHWGLETLDQSQTQTEIEVCKDEIERTFGVQVAHYALPFGKANPHIRSVLEQLGLKSLCTTAPGLVRTNTDPYALPRLMVGTDVLDLAGQVTLLHIQEYAASRHWRDRVR